VKNHLELVKKFHDLESAYYTDKRYNDRTCEGLSYLTRKSILLESIAGMPAGRLLDIGCGPGILTSELLSGGREVFSVDLSRRMLINAQASIHEDPNRKHAEFSNCEAAQICFRDESFAVVLCIGVMSYTEDYIAVMRDIYRILNGRGTTVVQIDRIACPLLYMILIPVYRWLKSKFTGKQYNEMEFKDNVFNYKRFLSDMGRIGYGIERIDYYDFRVPFIDIILPNLCVKLGKRLFYHRKMKFIRWLSHGMLISLKKK
jgi:2-polyprenyl-3-methyl-5-hydroxy-6-metoxy-1,4-benzoquinol methylase